MPGAGELVGEMAVFDPSPRLASVSAVTDTLLFRIEMDSFDEFMNDWPEIAHDMIQMLTRRLKTTTIKQ